LIKETALPLAAAILDVGGGTSTLARQLTNAGYHDLTVVDISRTALERARIQFGANADRIAWVQADVRSDALGRTFDLWHDRALFHFMVDPSDRNAYLTTLGLSLRLGGHLILATFGTHGPQRCSGLPVARYSPDALSIILGPEFVPISSRIEEHRTPSNARQEFTYAHFRRGAPVSG
jgi:SAM-dependent methyltransferase